MSGKILTTDDLKADLGISNFGNYFDLSFELKKKPSQTKIDDFLEDWSTSKKIYSKFELNENLNKEALALYQLFIIILIYLTSINKIRL